MHDHSTDGRSEEDDMKKTILALSIEQIAQLALSGMLIMPWVWMR